MKLNGEPVPNLEHIVKNGDLVTHTMHRHEPPVTAQPINAVFEDDDLIVINKPAGVPVHPAGRYHYNTIVEIMRAERNMQWNPLPCNRLDRLTSGIMFIAKHPAAAKSLMTQIQDRTVKKEYVARVKGEFPLGDVVCEQPILSISPKLGLNRTRANGKDAKTVFRRLAYYPPQQSGELSDGQFQPDTSWEAKTESEKRRYEPMAWKKKEGYSIVRCFPLTGRTHQIRVHLQYLGHPITNDPIYCNQRVWGKNLGKGGEGEDEDIIARLSKMGKEEVAEAVAYHDDMVEEFEKRKAEKLTGKLCEICDTELYSDPGLHELGIYLHAKKYASQDGRWSYQTPLPDWALPPVGAVGPVETTPETDPSLIIGPDGLILESDKEMSLKVVEGTAVAVNLESDPALTAGLIGLDLADRGDVAIKNDKRSLAEATTEN
jgi:tRNA pseudouridine32 synthase